MQLISPPSDWVLVSIDALESHLKTCPDYARESYIGATRYSYRHNGKVFAEVVVEDGVERVFIPPTK